MIDDSGKDDTTRLSGGKRRREPRTIDLASSEVVEETAPLAGHAGAETAIKREDEPGFDAGAPVEEAPGAPPADAAPGHVAEPPPRAAFDEPRGTSPSVRRGGSVGAVAFAGLLGGVAGAAAAFYLPTLFPAPDANAERIAALERSVQQQSGASATRGDVDGLGRRIVTLEQALRDLDTRLAAVSSEADETAQRLATLPAPQQAAGGAPDDGRLVALETRIGRIETAVERLTPLEAAIQRLGPLDAAVQRIAPIEAAVQRLDANSGRAGAEALARVEALEKRLAGIEKAASNARVDRIARVVLAGELARAVENGRPFAAELQALRSTALQSPALATLDAHAAAGAPTAEALLRDLRSLAGTITAESAPAPEGGVLDRLSASAARLVSVRPVDGAGGKSPGALVAQMETALERGDVAEALKIWQSLPEPGRRASQAFGAALQTRVAAAEAARSLAAGAKAELKGD